MLKKKVRYNSFGAALRERVSVYLCITRASLFSVNQTQEIDDSSFIYNNMTLEKKVVLGREKKCLYVFSSRARVTFSKVLHQMDDNFNF